MLPSANTSSPILAYSVYCPYSNLRLFVPLTSPSTIWYCLDFVNPFSLCNLLTVFSRHIFSWHADITPTKKHIVPLGIKNAWESNIRIQQLVILFVSYPFDRNNCTYIKYVCQSFAWPDCFFPSGQGWTRTNDVSNVTDLQSAVFAARLTCP